MAADVWVLLALLAMTFAAQLSTAVILATLAGYSDYFGLTVGGTLSGAPTLAVVALTLLKPRAHRVRPGSVGRAPCWSRLPAMAVQTIPSRPLIRLSGQLDMACGHGPPSLSRCSCSPSSAR